MQIISPIIPKKFKNLVPEPNPSIINIKIRVWCLIRSVCKSSGEDSFIF